MVCNDLVLYSTARHRRCPHSQCCTQSTVRLGPWCRSQLVRLGPVALARRHTCHWHRACCSRRPDCAFCRLCIVECRDGIPISSGDTCPSTFSAGWCRLLQVSVSHSFWIVFSYHCVKVELLASSLSFSVKTTQVKMMISEYQKRLLSKLVMRGWWWRCLPPPPPQRWRPKVHAPIWWTERECLHLTSLCF